MKQLIGQTLDRYQIISLLGQGGMGAVYRARDTKLKREVALKVMHAHLAAQPEFNARFVQEAQAAANLDHPSIVKVFDFKESDALLYIVMEFIPGGNLKQMLQQLRKSERGLSLLETVDLVQQIALALDYAHAQGVVHRDIKPANLMLKPDLANPQRYRPIVTDMGLAKLTESSIVTQMGESMGTPAYMSPEQALGRTIGPATDIYALGVLFYELVVGRLPYPANTLSEAFHIHHKGAPPPSPRSLCPDLPQAVEAVILQALANDPVRRFSTGRALADALEAIHRQTLITLAPAATPEESISLATLYAESVVERPPLLDQPDAAEPLVETKVTGIQIQEPNGGTRFVEVKRGAMTVGRDSENSIALPNDPRASRRHARIEFDGVNYKVTDLDSRNGTFLGNIQLLPAVPERWAVDKPLRIGDHWFHLQSNGPEVITPVVKPTVISTDAEPAGSRQEAELQVVNSQIMAKPGSATEMTVSLTNLASSVAHYQLAISGIPADWVSLPKPLLLKPTAQEQVVISIRPPRSPQSRAASYPLVIDVRRQDSTAVVATQRATLVITAYQQLALALDPPHKRSSQPGNFRLMVNNQGNVDLPLQLSAEAPAGDCIFTFDPPEVMLAAGAEISISMQVRLLVAAAVEAEQSHLFVVRAKNVRRPEVTREIQGEWINLVERPSFQIMLDPAESSSASYGTFRLQLRNKGQTDLSLQLTAIDPAGNCSFTFDYAQMLLGGGQERIAWMTIRPKQDGGRDATRRHPFTITAASTEPLVVTQRVGGVWVQLAPTNPIQADKIDNAVQPLPVKEQSSGEFGVRFCLLWTFLTALVWMIGGPVIRELVNEQAILFPAFTIYGAIAGFVGGVLQWLLLRSRMTGARWWIILSLIGWSVALSLTGSIASSIYSIVANVLISTIQGTAVGASQWWLLRRHQVSGLRWVGFNIVGLFLGFLVVNSLSGDSIFVGAAIRGVIYGAVTSYGLKSLLDQPNKRTSGSA